MAAVVVLILHPEAGSDAGPLGRRLAELRATLATRQRDGFAAAGAADVRIEAGPPDDTPFGARLRRFVEREVPRGLVVLGSGSVPLITIAERRALLSTAAADEPRALVNSRYSADVVALALAGRLGGLPDLATDNGLPRWLAETAGYEVGVLPRWQLGVDVDGLLDWLLVGRADGAFRSARDPAAEPDPLVARAEAAMDRVAAVAANPAAELVVAGRTSARTLGWLERSTACRVRAIVEERGMRSAPPPEPGGGASRPPRSVLGALLDRDGPEAFGVRLAELGDAAVIDTRVLLAHRLGPDERAWPPAEDRLASDLLLHERIGDAWLGALTKAAAAAPIPVLLGGHTLVGPGLRLALGPRRGRRA